MKIQPIKSKRTGKTTYRIQPILPDGRRVNFYLGAGQKKAYAVAKAIFDLIDSRRHGIDLSPETRAWLHKADKALIAKLAGFGLCGVVYSPTVEAFVADFIESKRSNSSASTIITYQNVEKHLNEFFPAGAKVADVTPADAERFASWLIDRDGGDIGINTARRRTGIARQIFNRAVDFEVITRNPFKHLRVSQSAAKKRYILPVELDKILDKCPSQEWRALFAMARHLGPRIPSEIETMVWGDVDWERNTILIRSPKTAGHGKAERLVPILPGVHSELQKLFEAMARRSQSELVFPTLSRHSNLSTTARKYVKRAAVPEWEKFWNAFRASAACDLMDQFGLRKSCAWMGHSAGIALASYSLTKATDFIDAGSPRRDDANNDADPARIDAHSTTGIEENADNSQLCGNSMGDEGLEPPTSCL